MEENFKKRSTKKIIIITTIIVLLVALIAGGVLVFLNSRNKPEKILEDKIKQAFKLVETEKESEEINSGRISLELSGEINSDMAEIKTINPIVKAVKINSVTEFDLNKNIFNQNLSASYDGEPVVSLDALLQDERIYVYLNELYSKYIDFTDMIEEELYMEDIDLESLFKTNVEIDTDALIKDIEQILIEEVSKLDLEQKNVELDGDKVRKTTCELSEKDVLKLLKKLLNKLDEYQHIEGMEELIEELDDELEYVDEDSGNYIEISLYTKGLNNNIVKLEAKVYSYDEEVMVIEYNKENDNKTTITAEADGAMAKVTIEKNSDTETVVSIAFNEYAEDPESEIELIKITLNEQNENEGTIRFAVNVEEVELILNVKYKVEKNAVIEKRDTTNSIKANEMGDSDLMELLENAQKNEILYGLITSIIMDNSVTNDLIDSSEDVYDYTFEDAYDETLEQYDDEMNQDFGYNITYPGNVIDSEYLDDYMY